jgi:hypothetical protein
MYHRHRHQAFFSIPRPAQFCRQISRLLIDSSKLDVPLPRAPLLRPFVSSFFVNYRLIRAWFLLITKLCMWSANVCGIFTQVCDLPMECELMVRQTKSCVHWTGQYSLQYTFVYRYTLCVFSCSCVLWRKLQNCSLNVHNHKQVKSDLRNVQCMTNSKTLKFYTYVLNRWPRCSLTYVDQVLRKWKFNDASQLFVATARG